MTITKIIQDTILKNSTNTRHFTVDNVIGEPTQLALKIKNKEGRAFEHVPQRKDVEKIVKDGVLANLRGNKNIQTNVLLMKPIEELGNRRVLFGTIDVVIEDSNTYNLLMVEYAQSSYNKAKNMEIEEYRRLKLSLLASLVDTKKDVKLNVILIAKDGSNRRKVVQPFISVIKVDKVRTTEVWESFITNVKRFSVSNFSIKNKTEPCSDLEFNSTAYAYPRPTRCYSNCDYSLNCPHFNINDWQKEKAREQDLNVKASNVLLALKQKREKLKNAEKFI